MEIKIDVPNGTSGNWRVEEFEVSKNDAQFCGLRAVFNGGRGRLPEGIYKRLYRGNVLVMSNTPDEIRDFMPFVRQASGSVLINGMGLGVLLKALLEKEEVKEITVIEKSEDVIKLVAPTYLKDKRVKVIKADAFEYEPEKGKRFDSVWHDIWDYITSDNLPEMAKLHRKYGRRTDYQESWCKDECKRRR